MKKSEEEATRLQDLFEAHDFDGVVRLLEEIKLRRPLDLPELLLLGRAIQLGSAETLTLEQAEASYAEILERDGDYVPGLLDMGWFLFAVQDDASRALPYFDRALELSKRHLEEAEDGKGQCEEEIAERNRVDDPPDADTE